MVRSKNKIMYPTFLQVFLFFGLFFMANTLDGEEPKITVSFYDETLAPGKPVQGLITIMHSDKDAIPLESFKLKDQKLNPTFLKKTEVGNGLVISLYQFAIASRQKGLYVLPPIKVKVGAQEFQTPSMTYEIKPDGSSGESPNATAKTKDGDPIIFALKSFVDGKSELYPGQKIIVGYFYIFNNNIEITKETLPLFEAGEFKKVGAQQVSNYKQSGLGIRQIAQELKADKPGNYRLGPSIIEGKVYRTSSRTGEKEYISDVIRAEAPAVNLLVKSFPDRGKPASFNGAIGEDLQFKVEIQSLPELSVGDKLTLSLAVTGKGDFESLPMPDVCCQPGFPGKFRLSDFPPAVTVKGSTKYFVVEMTPLSSSIKAIPPIEFSYFNLKTESYTTLRSAPIPIKVHEAPKGAIAPEGPAEEIKDENKIWNEPKDTPEALEISSIYPITKEDLASRFLGTLSAIWLIPMGLLALYLQSQLKRRRNKPGFEKVSKKPQEILNEADKTNLHALIEKSLMQALFEKGLISRQDLSPHELDERGITGEVRAFFEDLEEARFSGKEHLSYEAQKQKALELLDKIKKAD